MMRSMTLRTAIVRFDAQLRADGKSPVTRSYYLWDLERLARALGPQTPIRSVTPHRLALFVNSPGFSCTPDGTPKKASSINRSKTALRVFFRFLVDSDYLVRDPARLVRSARVQQPTAKAMLEAEVNRLLKTIGKDRGPLARRDELMFRLMLGTGIRLGSLVGLNVEDVDLKPGTVRIRVKGGTEQTVYLHAALRRAIGRYVPGLDNSGPLFRSSRGPRIGTRQVQMRFAHWRDQAGLSQGYTVHSLRHTFATRLYQQTRDLHLVRDALGHAGVGTTQRYAVIDRRSLRAAVARLS